MPGTQPNKAFQADAYRCVFYGGMPAALAQINLPVLARRSLNVGVSRLRRWQKGTKAMIDNYYLDLARGVLAKAESNLVSVQQYLRDAGLEDEIVVTQRIINRIRNQNDYLALLPSNKAFAAEAEAGPQSAQGTAKSEN